jgi:hypothetical protein
MYSAVERYFDDFLGHCAFPATASGVGPAWTTAITGTTPTIAGLTNSNQGEVKLILTSTSQAQVASLYHGDICSFKSDNLLTASFRVKVLTTDITTAESVVFGMTTARNDNPDTPTVNAQFKLAASTAVVVESDDNSTDNDDKATGQTLTYGTYKEFMIDFRHGYADVRFYMSDSNGRMTRVGAAVTHGVGTGVYLQPNILLAKASGTTTPAICVDYVEILYKRS